jgi:hypothetical protein
MNGHSHNGGAYKSARVTRERVGPSRVFVATDRASLLVMRCDASELQHFICSVMQLGWCVTFTQTSDGGACSVTCYDGNIRYKSYARHEDELPLCFRDLLAAIRGEE